MPLVELPLYEIGLILLLGIAGIFVVTQVLKEKLPPPKCSKNEQLGDKKKPKTKGGKK